MKRVLLLIVAIGLMVAGPVWAAGTIAVTSDVMINSRALNHVVARVITVTFTADASDGTIPDLTLHSSTSGLRGIGLKGWYGHQLFANGNSGGTEVTENSEVYLYQNGFDLLGGGGVDNLDNTANRLIWFSDGTTKRNIMITDDLTLTLTQQAVATNSATGTIGIVLLASE